MNGDPKVYRVIGACLISTYIVCLSSWQTVPPVVLVPTVAFFAWRWWEQHRNKPPERKPAGTEIVVADKPLIDAREFHEREISTTDGHPNASMRDTAAGLSGPSIRDTAVDL